jgi:hypothetical protein
LSGAGAVSKVSVGGEGGAAAGAGAAGAGAGAAGSAAGVVVSDMAAILMQSGGERDDAQ